MHAGEMVGHPLGRRKPHQVPLLARRVGRGRFVWPSLHRPRPRPALCTTWPRRRTTSAPAMRLARGEAGAVEDVERALELAEAAHDPQVVHPTLAFAGHVFWTVGETGTRAESVLARHCAMTALRGRSPPFSASCELAWLASRSRCRGRRSSTRSPMRPPTPWVETARAIIVRRAPPCRRDPRSNRAPRPEAAYTRMRSGDAGRGGARARLLPLGRRGALHPRVRAAARGYGLSLSRSRRRRRRARPSRA